MDGIVSLNPLNTFKKIGVQAQVFTIVNDEKYYYPDLIRGMIVDEEFGKDVSYYTGSTTGTSRNNEICSRYTPITWQVDRKCHLISASSFDKMCADMLNQRDDMSGDLHPHGARELVLTKFAADNHQRRLEEEEEHQRRLAADSGTCPKKPTLDLCMKEDKDDHADHDHPAPTPTPTPSSPSPSPSSSDTTEVSSAVRQTGGARGLLMMFLMTLAMGKWEHGGALFTLPLMLEAASAASTTGDKASKCSTLKSFYDEAGCCGHPSKVPDFAVVPMPSAKSIIVKDNAANPCAGKKLIDAPLPDQTIKGYFNNVNCTLEDGVVNALEQSGTNVTKGYKGDINTSAEVLGTSNRQPITTSYWEAGLCPVNVHWHLGTEHLSVGEYDENGKGPEGHRRLAKNARKGFSCHHYDKSDPKFTTEYDWKHCVDTHVGETYEVHWPHSAAGACGTPNQYQTPFYDGVFCNVHKGIISLLPLNTFKTIGVHGQIFTIVNDEKYYYPDLIRGMIVDEEFGTDVAKYTGSTTGTSRNNEICSRYTPITWQVDRKCHMVSASTFDKMCQDMKAQADDMSGDLHPHGSRELVAHRYAANNQQS